MKTLIGGLALGITVFGFDPSQVPEIWSWTNGSAAEFDSKTYKGYKKISRLRDLSGNSRDYTQTDFGKMPLYSAGARNNLPTFAVQVHDPQQMNQNGTLNASGGFYVASVFKTRDGHRAFAGTTSGNYLVMGSYNERILAVIGSPCSGWMCNSMVLTEDHSYSLRSTILVEVWRDDQGRITTYINGQNRTKSPQPVNNKIFAMTGFGGTGPTYHWDNQIYELMVFKGLPSSENRANIRNELNCKWKVFSQSCSGVSVERGRQNLSSSPLKVQPNPFKGVVRFQFLGFRKEKTGIDILDMSGRKIRTLTTNNLQLNTHWAPKSNVSAGIYFARVFVNGKTLEKRITFLK